MGRHSAGLRKREAGASGQQPRPVADRAGRLTAAWAAGVFLVLLGAYLANGDFLPGNDAKANVYLPVSLLREGNLSFTPREAPFMFIWQARLPPASGGAPEDEAFLQRWRRFAETAWSNRVDGWQQRLIGVSAERLYAWQMLGNPGPMYYIIKSIRNTPDGQPLYVNTFGPGAGLCALPMVAAAELFTDLPADAWTLWYGAKLAAAMLVAGSAVFVFLSARLFTTSPRSAVLALGYGLGTCVWSISSQAMWQHGPNEFFLAMGSYFLLRSRREAGRMLWPALCGAALAAAVACRPTSALAALAVGVYLLVVSRRAMAVYVLGALPIAAALAGYNTYYLGAPWRFGQAAAGQMVALQKTGSPKLWSTPLWEGAAGLMLSPSRGLLVFSPIVLLSVAGLARMWRRSYAPLIPLLAGMLALWVIAFKWFDWWGGWCFGYRPLVDTMPLLAVLAVPALDWLFARRWALAVAAVLLAWSVMVQVLGAWAFDMTGWNLRVVHIEMYLKGQDAPMIISDPDLMEQIIKTREVVRAVPLVRDIDQPKNRHRLWSIKDSQILYSLQRFAAARKQKKEDIRMWLEHPSS